MKKPGSKKALISIVGAVAVLLIALLVLLMPKSAEASKVAEQLNLGDKYLSELNYEQAIVAYQAVIEIDPKNVDAYLGLADIYMAQGEYDKAIEVLEEAQNEVSGISAEQIEKELLKVRQVKKSEEEKARPKPTNTPIPMATSTPMPEPTPTEVPTATPIPTPEPTLPEVPEPTTAPRATATPKPTNTPVPTSTPTPVPVAEGSVRVELKLGSDGFTYGTYEDTYVCTGLSEKGYAEFQKYNSAHLVSIQLPDVSDTGEAVKGFYSNSDGGYDLTELLTEDSAYVELVCADGYEAYYGVYRNELIDGSNHKLKNLIFNDGIKVLGAYAFENCIGLEKMVIPDSVERIVWGSFTNCDNVIIDEFRVGTRELGGYIFDGVRINKLIIDDECYVVENGCFYNSDIGVIEISDDLTKLPDRIFAGAFIEEFVLPDNIEVIGRSAFEGSKIKKITLHDNLREIGPYAFFDCVNLKSIEVPESVELVDWGAFGGYESMEYFTIITPSGSAAEQYAIENNIPVEAY